MHLENSLTYLLSYSPAAIVREYVFTLFFQNAKSRDFLRFYAKSHDFLRFLPYFVHFLELCLPPKS